MGNLCSAPQAARDPAAAEGFEGVGVRNPSHDSTRVESSDSESDAEVQRQDKLGSKRIQRDPSAARSGQLMKFTQSRGKSAGAWRARHVELNGAVLRFFSKTKFRGQIVLTGTEVALDKVTVTISRRGRKPAIGIFKAETAESARDWAIALRSAAELNEEAAMAAIAKRGQGKKKTRQVVFAQALDPEEVLRSMPTVTKSAGTISTLKQALQKHFLFSGLDAATMTRVVGAMELEVMPSGGMIINEGDRGDKLFVLEKGTVQFIKGGQAVGTATQGAVFGELAIMYDAPRAASVRVDAQGVVWSLRQDYFKALLASGATNQAVQRVNFLRRVKLLEPLSEQQISRIADAMNVETFAATTRIVKQGDVGDRSEEVVLIDLGEGDYFGELALMNNEPRKAHVTAVSDVTCFTLEKVQFNQILGSLADVLEHQNRVRLLKGMDLLQDLSDSMFGKIADNLQLLTFTTGQHIVKEGETGSEFYIVFNGEAVVTAGGKQVAVLSKGQYFGERSLLKDEPRSATVTAKGDAQVFTMSRNTFVRLLGPLDRVLRGVAEQRDRETAKALGKAAPEPTRGTPQLGAVTLADLEAIGILGTGGFGTVKMVKHKRSGQIMALKILSKAHIRRKKQIAAVINEKTALQTLADAPFVVRLYGSFQDANSLYLLLQVVPGGELWSAMYNEPSPLPRGRFGGLAVPAAVFYFLNVVLAMREVHSQGYAYRDLKPENLLVDRDGFLTMVDFGFAKRIPPMQSSFTLCGTPEYLAPELVLGRGHNQAADMWALGIFIYELVVGVTPFFSESQSDMFNKIINAQSFLAFPKNTPKEVVSVIQSLLRVKPSTRLGMLKDGYDEILQHPVFKGINVGDMLTRKIPAPWVPPVSSERDLSFFAGAEDEHPIEPYTGPQSDFRGF